MKFNYDLQRFADGDNETTYTTTTEISSDTTSTDTTTILVFDGQKVVTEEVFEYGLEKMRAYNKKRYLPKAGIALMQKSDVDKMFNKWEEEDAAEDTVADESSSDDNNGDDDQENESDNP